MTGKGRMSAKCPERSALFAGSRRTGEAVRREPESKKKEGDDEEEGRGTRRQKIKALSNPDETR